ncbi:MAG: hypothetical protein WCK35_29035, partial [Chloroflexota bacterium]
MNHSYQAKSSMGCPASSVLRMSSSAKHYKKNKYPIFGAPHSYPLLALNKQVHIIRDMDLFDLIEASQGAHLCRVWCPSLPGMVPIFAGYGAHL